MNSASRAPGRANKLARKMCRSDFLLAVSVSVRAADLYQAHLQPAPTFRRGCCHSIRVDDRRTHRRDWAPLVIGAPLVIVALTLSLAAPSAGGSVRWGP